MPDDAEAAFWDALQARDYAEEGIPMLLAVETVGAASPSPGGAPGDSHLGPALLASAERLRGKRAASPASVIEMLAARELDALSDD